MILDCRVSKFMCTFKLVSYTITNQRNREKKMQAYMHYKITLCLLFLMNFSTGFSDTESYSRIFSPYPWPLSQTTYIDYNNDDNIITKLSKTIKHLKTGTTIVGISCEDCIILGADTRSTGGPLIMDKEKLKIHKISNTIYTCAAGTSADCDQITKDTSYQLNLLKLKHIIGQNYDHHYYDPIPSALHYINKSMQTTRTGSQEKEDKKSSVMILGGYDSQGPSLYSIEEDGSATQVSFAALGSGSTDAIAIIEDYLYHHNNHAHYSNHSHSNKNNYSSTTYSSSLSYKGESSPLFPRRLYDRIGQVKRTGLTLLEGIDVVREAVTAGILNDLGSGNWLDICVIERHGAIYWREKARTTEGKNYDRWQPPSRVLSYLVKLAIIHPPPTVTSTVTSLPAHSDKEGDGLRLDIGRLIRKGRAGHRLREATDYDIDCEGGVATGKDGMYSDIISHQDEMLSIHFI